MAKTLRTSGDYTIKTGTGSSGSNTVFFDSKTTRVLGDFVVDGDRTELNTSTMTIEDKFIEVNKGNSTADTEDSGNQFSSFHHNQFQPVIFRTEILFFCKLKIYEINTIIHQLSILVLTIPSERFCT